MEFQAVMEARRAVEHFDPQEPVPRETLDEIIAVAAQVPSSFNLQPWNLIVVTDPAEKARLRQAAWDQPKVTQAPVVLVLLADRAVWREGHPTFDRAWREMEAAGVPPQRYNWFKESCYKLYGQSGERGQAFACKNTGMFALALMLAAKDRGLDSHPMDGFDLDAVRELFKVPARYWIPMLICLGRFDESQEPPAPKWRRTPDEIVVRFD